MTTATEVTLNLTNEEATQLMGLLEQSLKDAEIEEHRTDALSYKEFVKHNKDVLRDLVMKLRGRL